MPDFLHQFTSNQLLVAGIGTTIAATAAMHARSLAATLKAFLRDQLVSTLTARSNGSYVTRLTKLVAANRLHASSASYSIDEGGKLTIGYGAGIARWKGVWIWYNLWIDTSVKTWDPIEVLDLTFLARDRRIVDRFVNEAFEASRKQRDTIDVHYRADNRWRGVARKKRALTTVFANAGLVIEIVEKVAWFLANEAWYLRRGLNYKLVILLHGVPGTGKSSLIQAVASHFDRDLYCVDSLLAVGPDIGELGNGILAIEDIDTLGALKRESATGGEGSPALAPSIEDMGLGLAGPRTMLHGVLNTLDGLGTPHGLVTIITTNHVEALDPALVRPCRIDMMREVTPLDYDAFRAMFASYFDDAMPDVAPGAYMPQTGARLQEVLMAAATPQAASDAVRALTMRRREVA